MSSTRGKKIDLRARRFGRLIVVREHPIRANGAVRWVCRCDCGNETVVLGNNLRRGTTKSCGCLQVEHGRITNRKHGHASGGKLSTEYIAWSTMHWRCSNPNRSDYRRYGGRGIKVCDEWGEFQPFFEYVGSKPSPQHTLDRIDNNKDYEPGNVRWASPRQQANNRNNNLRLTHNGMTLTLSEWATKTGINYNTLQVRLRLGWSLEKTLTTAPRRKRSPQRDRSHRS